MVVDEHASPAGIARGAHVIHKTFGPGVVLEVDGSQDPTATVKFAGWSPKRIKVRFLSTD